MTDEPLAEVEEVAPDPDFWERQADREAAAHAETRKRMFAALYPDDGHDGLLSHAKRELRLAGLYKEDSFYGGMLPEAVLELIAVFAAQGHSGMSASVAVALLTKLLRYEALTPLTDDPDEWNHVGTGDNGPLYQSRRQSTCFSSDGLHSYYNLDEDRHGSSAERVYHLLESKI